MILKMVTELGSEVKLTPPDGVQSFHVQHLPHPYSGISDCSIVTSDQWHSCGDGVRVVDNDCTPSGGVNLTSDPSSVTIFKIISCWRNDAIVESEAENAHFQPSEWAFLTTKHSPRFANNEALALREKIAAGMDFRGANHL